MNDVWVRVRPLLFTARILVATAVLAVFRHWPLTIFSVVLAFAIWFLVEDVENPRIEATVPGEDQAAIPVEVVNVPPGLIVGEVTPIRVFVEAREGEVDELRAADFEAVVDASGVRAGEARSLPVTVTTERRDVRVVRPEPGTVEVSVVADREQGACPSPLSSPASFPRASVRACPRSSLPSSPSPAVEGLVESVDQVQATVSIAGLQTTQTFNVELAPSHERRLARHRHALPQWRAREPRPRHRSRGGGAPHPPDRRPGRRHRQARARLHRYRRLGQSLAGGGHRPPR